MTSWKFWMQPRNSKSAPVKEIIVEGENIDDATSRAIAKCPGHIWLQHEELPDETAAPSKVFVVVHKEVSDEPTALRTTRIEAKDGDQAFNDVQAKYPGHQILQVEQAAGEMHFYEGDEADLHEKDANGICKMDGWNCPLDAQPIVHMPTEYGGAVIVDDEPITMREAKAKLLEGHGLADEPKDGHAGPWRPSVSEDEQITLETIVAQAVGAGSTCWSEPSNGIFDTDEARRIVDGAVKAIMEIGSAYMLRFDEKANEGPVDSAPDPQVEQLEQENLRLKDKLFLLAWLVEHQAPFGTELANFKRRLALLIGA